MAFYIVAKISLTGAFSYKCWYYRAWYTVMIVWKSSNKYLKSWGYKRQLKFKICRESSVLLLLTYKERRHRELHCFRKVQKKHQSNMVLNYINFCTAMACYRIHSYFANIFYFISAFNTWWQWSYVHTRNLELCMLWFLMLKLCYCITLNSLLEFILI